MTCLLTLRCFGLLFTLAIVLASNAVAAEPTDSDDAFFERQVRPLLAEKCFSCHGRGQRKGELSLDSRAGVLQGGESGAAAVVGKPEESLLVQAVGYAGDIQMPPDAKLSDREIEILKRWVAMGLPWPAETAGTSSLREPGKVTDDDRGFWSFRPIVQPPLPAVQETAWPRKPLDYFILSRLEAEKIEPVAEADRRTLIRRATFDLLGLPPSDSEIEDFVGDAEPDAYERLIERLLNSPHYGERWARHWLDVARYAEDQAHTFAARMYPSAYRYRDWVVESLNADLPIDQFIAQQIAGDLLPGDNVRERLPALGFFALGPVYYADAGCAPKAKADEYDDRIDTLCRGILGLTVSCARCHDHKFDPILSQDYYALAGVFASTEYAETPLAPPETVRAYDEAQRQIKQAEQELKEAESLAQREAGEALGPRVAQYLVAAWRVQNRRKAEPKFAISKAIEGTDLEEFLVDRWLKFLASAEAKNSATLKPWLDPLSPQDAAPDLSDDPAAIESVQCQAEAIQFAFLAAVETHREWYAQYQQRLANASAGEKKPEKPALPGVLKELLEGGNAPLAIPRERLEKYVAADTRETLERAKKEVETRKAASPAKYPIAHSLVEGKPTNSKLHVRGNVNELGPEVPRQFLTVLSSSSSTPFAQGSGRLELARAIVDRDNPLTARVFVNRVWHHHFARGIVGTPSNFGLLGERPTHPELLDYLAAKFIDSGWSLKELHRNIMLSSTYRLASTSHAAGEERDPENRLLWRMNRRRLDIEALRDATLQASGTLNAALGGPPQDLRSSGNRRRTLYAAVSRHELNPVLRLFDFPDANLTSERRVVTTVPMQQLFFFNSDFMVQQSRALAARLDAEKLPDEPARIERLYRWLFGRTASQQEIELGLAYLQRPLPAGVSTSDVKLSRWEQYAQALLSTNEFLFVD
jgi:cytochrome c553